MLEKWCDDCCKYCSFECERYGVVPMVPRYMITIVRRAASLTMVKI